MTAVTTELGAFAAALQYSDVPDDVRERCKLSILDGLAVMFAAASFAKRNGDTLLSSYLKMTAPPGNATVFGHGVRTTPLMAAFGNGTLMEALDYQDGSMNVLGHSGTGVIPAVLALAETTEVTWKDVMPAIIAGYEVHMRLLRAIQPGHWYKGFQSTGTFGTCGAASAAGRIFRFDKEHMASALGVAGFVMPVSNSDNMFKGYNVKPVHGGQAAMCGLSAAYMAQVGYQGGPLEGEPPRHHGSLRILSGDVLCEKSLTGLGDTWYMRDTAYKPYPVGHFIVGVLELLLDILTRRPMKLDEIAGIDISTYYDAYMTTGIKYTTANSNHVDAHLSIPYCVAVTIADGNLTPEQLLRKRIQDSKLHEFAAKVTVKEDPEMTKAYPKLWPLRIVIRFKDGSIIDRRIDTIDWSPDRPPSWASMSEKFRQMADPVIGAERAKRAVDLLAEIKPEQSLKPLMETLQTP